MGGRRGGQIRSLGRRSHCQHRKRPSRQGNLLSSGDNPKFTDGGEDGSADPSEEKQTRQGRSNSVQAARTEVEA